MEPEKNLAEEKNDITGFINTDSEEKEFFTKNRKLVALGLIVLILALLLGFLFKNNESFPEKREDTVTLKVRLGWVHQAQFAGFYVAKEKGFYNDVGINVELLPLDFNISQGQELEDGTADVSIMEAHQLLVDIDRGLKNKAVAVVYNVNPHALAVRSDSGINDPEDFGGKVIGLSGGDGEGSALFEVFINRFSQENPVTYKNLGFDTVDDFKNNRADIIDVYRIDQPYLAQKNGIPLSIIALDAYGFSTYGDVVVMNDDFIRDNEDVVKRFAGASLKGLEYAISNPEEAVDITLKYAEGVYGDREYQEYIMYNSIPLIQSSGKIFGQMEFIPWSTLFESMKAAGAIEGEFKVSDIYTNRFID